ncbi:MAG: methyltransferase domain-containing protein [Lachnospiraceae bacterium]|nr:methyltransferase domain-containing protein [Lachnospiraceae bacterium]
MLQNITIDYYNKNAETFAETTIDVNLVETQDKFLNCLSHKGKILDFGCGSGRDTKYFLEKGYNVDATDGSEELCKIASNYTGIEVKRMLFSELDAVEKYDGIWACSSILHLPKNELKIILQKMEAALKVDGVIYTSFKYGKFEGERNGRYFTDFTIELFTDYLQDIENLQIEEYWITGDVRPGRGEEKWLNLILRKTDIH